MSGYTPDEKLRLDQLRKLRKLWLKDQELSPREPVIQAKPLGAVAKFWAGFLEPKSLWRLYTYKAYTGGVFAITRLLIPAWLCHYWVKYHIAPRPYGIVDLKPKLFPGDTIQETGEVIPNLPEFHGHH
ncbi:NADH dehydrogenase [ubiquinone] 1 beta subcomplex subunit 6 [Notothenia coriiceps]|uniref:NADH dehydrogenase [ubiquinone] 1 beta subcomplex subunit 6 n=1 Tax=Notothenia coriiceps TaxID=8208 RepID=A0A6I9PMU0_9TELE|nr:PREDICTED: NADH dehydrogenase [ubiquinone] 1 beta subcomplex subunit 6 [Notothenia coriiceps]